MPGTADKLTQSAQSRLLSPDMTKDRTMTPSRIHRLSLTHFRNFGAASVQPPKAGLRACVPDGCLKTSGNTNYHALHEVAHQLDTNSRFVIECAINSP
jgi:hypothetical protein